MKRTWFLALVVALLALVPASAADLSKIERRIERQPDGLKAPSYCLLAFGREALMRKWVIVDGSDLYVDLNGNGDLTDVGEKFPLLATVNLGPVTDADGSERNARLSVNRMTFGMRMILNVGDRCTQYVGYDPGERLALGNRPEDAPIVHIGGALTFRWFGKPPELLAGKTCRFFTSLGTPGLGKGSFAAVQCCHVPKSAGLVALIDYPSRDIEQSPIQVKQSLAAD